MTTTATNCLPTFDHAAHLAAANACDAALNAWREAGYPESGALSDAVYAAHNRFVEVEVARLAHVAAIAKCRGRIR
jgi:hypothetical protein